MAAGWSVDVKADSKSEALGGSAASPWYQGDFVVSYAGDARSGDRTAPGGSLAGAVGSVSPVLLIGAGIVLVGLLLRHRKAAP